METEYIEKQEAISLDPPERYERKYQTMNLDDAYEAGWDDALGEIRDLPPADVRPMVPGEWLNKERVGFGSIEAECSNCGRRMIFNNAWMCCPWCMADMRSGDAK